MLARSAVCRLSVLALVIGSASILLAEDLPDLSRNNELVQLVEHEFDPRLLENLPVPGEVPVQIQLPPDLIRRDQWRGSQCGLVRPVQLVVRSSEHWQQLWNKALRPYSPKFDKVPPIDFATDMVVAVFAGEKPTPGHAIEIRSAEPAADPDLLIIRFKNVKKMQPVFNPPFNVQPFHLRKVPAHFKRVVFEEIKP